MEKIPMKKKKFKITDVNGVTHYRYYSSVRQAVASFQISTKKRISDIMVEESPNNWSRCDTSGARDLLYQA